MQTAAPRKAKVSCSDTTELTTLRREIADIQAQIADMRKAAHKPKSDHLEMTEIKALRHQLALLQAQVLPPQAQSYQMSSPEFSRNSSVTARHESPYKRTHLPHHSLKSLEELLDVELQIEGANREAVPYLGYIELNLTFPEEFLGKETEVPTLVLVVPDSFLYGYRVVLKVLEVRQTQASTGAFGLIKAQSYTPEVVPAGSTVVVEGQVHMRGAHKENGTHGSSTLPFTRSFRTCEADKETVEGDTGGNDHPQQQHKHHESVRQPSFDRVEGDTGCYIHSQHPQDMDERPGEGGSESSPSRLTHMAPPKLSPQQGGGGLGENPSDLSLLAGMLELDVTPQQILMNGSKILSFEESHYGLKFIDSLSFLPMRLSAMPKALGFTDKTKGYFPHKFSSEIHLNYVGPYPVPSDYGVDHMTVREREEFDPWYNEVSRGTFDFKKEASLYCKNDVDILTQGSLKFRDQFLVQCDMRGVTFGELHYKSEKRYLLLPLRSPRDHLQRFRGPTRSYYGFIRATVYPPRGLLFPVLPHKSEGGKLLFTLCRTCAETNNEGGPCEHDDEGRALTGVWVTVEFIKALEVGYRVGKITEVWHFDKSSDTVFTDYIHTFLKGKQEASGYPAEATDRESREKYIRDYQEHQGILLDAGKIETNPVKRQVAKLCLNSLWGKFAQRDNLFKTTIVSDPKEFFSYMFSAFTTAHARLKLYSYLEKLQDRVFYIDTDSLIYLVKEGEKPLELGNYLGDLTDELDGDSIQEFAAAGPKSYAYQTRNKKKVVMRVKDPYRLRTGVLPHQQAAVYIPRAST
ncbi:hypothetical protein D4764_15G0008700 [Takifugu flavidus]|uniref:DNA-directed DNA polymerase n=1 Tax=Takifugu flavidus TaxID=433684 RepID=A0A5C6P306_9TELE|nr:hypothetical protein D4764_15G0008700 [Takifugu flavidus]